MLLASNLEYVLSGASSGIHYVLCARQLNSGEFTRKTVKWSFVQKVYVEEIPPIKLLYFFPTLLEKSEPQGSL